jgi:hypothetical protein
MIINDIEAKGTLEVIIGILDIHVKAIMMMKFLF